MDLGTFSVSLTVKDIQVSKAFYEKLGFEVIGGALEQNYLILQNGDAKIGLFQGMFDENILTFNAPDVRTIQGSLKEQGVELTTEVNDADENGFVFITMNDPDGNQIMLDQPVWEQ